MVCTLFKCPFNLRLNERVLNPAKGAQTQAKVLKVNQRVRPLELFERLKSRSDLTNTVKTRKKQITL